RHAPAAAAAGPGAAPRRYRAREDALGPDEVRYWLSELWARGAADLPVRGMRKLGVPWTHAADWLARLRVADREAGLAAGGAWPATGPLMGPLAHAPQPPIDPGPRPRAPLPP